MSKKSEVIHIRIDTESKKDIMKISKAENRSFSAQCQNIFREWLAVRSVPSFAKTPYEEKLDREKS